MAAPAMLQMTVSRDGTTAYDQFNSSIQDEGSKTHDQYDKEENNNYIRKIFPRGYVSELKALCTLAIPLIITQLTQYTTGPVALMFCGRLGKIELDAATMANTMINVMGTSVAVGLATACDTLFSQIYGSNNKRKLGVVLIRSLIFIPLCVLPPLAVQLNAENVLLALGQEPIVAKLAAEYLLIFIPGLVGFFVYMPLSKYLQNQNIIIPSMVIGLIANIINIVLHLILVTQYEYGLWGSAIAQMTSFASFPCMTLAYILISKMYIETWTGWSAECLLDWWQMFLLGWFGLLMVCIEWWSYEVGLILAGVLGTTELGAQAIIFQIATFAYMPSLGIAVAANIRVGHFLGANDSHGALNCCSVALSITWGFSILLGILVCTLRDYLPQMTTNVTEVIDMAAATLPWYAIACLFEGTFIVCGGILRGSGRQHIGAIVIFSAYLVGLAIAIPVMLKTETVRGFWQGMVVAIAIEAFVLAAITFLTDWDTQALKAKERVSLATARQLNSGKLGNENCEKMPLISENNVHSVQHVSVWIYIRTSLVVLIMLSLLVAGVLCRIYLPPPQLPDSEYTYDNSTFINNTSYQPFVS